MLYSMLINAIDDEIRIAIVSQESPTQLVNLDTERKGQDQKKANIYKARIARIERSLDAVFVDYGSERHGFLPFKELPAELHDHLSVGQELLVQVVKEERGSKGAALSCFISLAGCYLVLMPNSPNSGGISRRIEGADRSELKDILDTLVLPEGMGFIIRTAGLGRTAEELQWDLSILLAQWDAIVSTADNVKAPAFIYQESDIISRALRDHLRPDIAEIVIDHPDTYDRVYEQLQRIRPDYVKHLKLYKQSTPLFVAYPIESQVETAFLRTIPLDNGASIVIDKTEALVAIDINSAKATEGNDIEETAYKANLAAVQEIARQLRLRDLGGLIVIDFIDMASTRNQKAVEHALREALKIDRARVQIGPISRFGLLTMSRQRRRLSLGETHHHTCTHCHGSGTIRTIPSLALALLRSIEADALKQVANVFYIHAPYDLASYIMNEERSTLVRIESSYNTKIIVIASNGLSMPDYRVERFAVEDVAHFVSGQPSYQRSCPQGLNPAAPTRHAHHPPVSSGRPPLLSTVPAAAPRQAGLLRRIWDGLFGGEDNKGDGSALLHVSSLAPEKAAPSSTRRSGGQGKTGRKDHHGRHSGQGQGSGQRRSSQRSRSSDRSSHGPAPVVPQDTSAALTAEVAPLGNTTDSDLGTEGKTTKGNGSQNRRRSRYMGRRKSGSNRANHDENNTAGDASDFQSDFSDTSERILPGNEAPREDS